MSTKSHTHGDAVVTLTRKGPLATIRLERRAGERVHEVDVAGVDAEWCRNVNRIFADMVEGLARLDPWISDEEIDRLFGPMLLALSDEGEPN